MNKLFMVIIYKNGKEITRAKGNDIVPMDIFAEIDKLEEK